MSSIANLTAAEKRAITIAAKAEKERQEQVALQAETSESYLRSTFNFKSSVSQGMADRPRRRRIKMPVCDTEAATIFSAY
jgi:hypothetical protein